MNLSEKANDSLQHRRIMLQQEVKKYEENVAATLKELGVVETQLACQHDFQKNGKIAEYVSRCVSRYECLKCGATTFDVETA